MSFFGNLILYWVLRPTSVHSSQLGEREAEWWPNAGNLPGEAIRLVYSMDREQKAYK
jgi:hypothetical protein